MDIYVGPPTFFLAPQWPPHFLNSRIATDCENISNGFNNLKYLCVLWH